ncbi:MAG: hypothetical protein K2L17_00960 [Muribaculaceae bacterium]|nr:hypothetical protein [Muribaculaceae bacterium]
MKKFHILAAFGIAVMATLGLSSCQADKDPVFTEATEFVLNTPPFADQLYQLAPNSTLELTCSQPNYGMALAPAYEIQVSLLENFGAGQPTPSEGEPPYYASVLTNNPHSAVIEIDEKNLAVAICELMGLNEENYLETPINVVPLYVRAVASISNQPSTVITSNTIVLKQVLTYFQAPAPEHDVLYTPGNSNGWNHANCQQLEAYEEGKYRGFVYLNGEFKFTNKDNWDGTNYGSAGEGKLDTDGGAGNLPLPAEGEGLYYADVDINTLSYTLTYIESVGTVGAYNDWNQADAAAHMTHSDDYLKWTYEGQVSGEFKFVFNDGWAINLGSADLENLEFGGPNCTTSGATVITLDLSKLPYSATAE